MMRIIAAFFLLIVAFALATMFFGWWTVPLIGLAYGILADPRHRPGWLAALAAGAAWALLLAWTASQGPVGLMAEKLAGIMRLPSSALYLITVMFPLVLAGCSTGLCSAIKGK